MSPVPDVDDFSAPFEDWIRDHLTRLTEAAETDIDALAPEELDEALTSRLAGAERLHDTGLGFSYAVPFADGVDEVLTLDLPTSVVTLPDSRVEGLGRYVPTLLELGRANLRRLLDATEVDVERLSAGDQSCILVHGDSPYTASFARFLLDAVARWVPGADATNGVVFAMPHRHAVVLQTCSTAAETRAALDLVPWHAAQLWGEGVGPVSPHTYHWHDRHVTTLTHLTPEGTLALRPTPLLESLVEPRRHVG
ncbi:hypothetical protein [Phycicoccus flavus]|uniref:hypothetical protein n=1 Tax=Phycicoccus flavus TaxID=2502783 RepID=UPI000FEBE66D|nr:hypothetical protein [Phycicoccus flavus]NHA67006.1 hypothetical protein [Phycicoccus flavus]